MTKKYIILFALFFLALALVFVLPFFGMETIDVSQVFNDSMQREIFLFIRLPRVLTAFFAGAALAVCGLVFQGVFKNPMADPFTLGVASGASFGAAFMIIIGVAGTFFAMPTVTIGALVGAALSFAIVMTFSNSKRGVSSNTILLTGIATSFFFSSLLMFLQYMSDMRDSFKIVRWLMGGVETFGYGQLLSMLPFVVCGLVLIILNVIALDHFLTGDDTAQTRGVRVRFSRNILLFAATIIVGGVVSVCGPIGFVGLMIPHICRKFFGYSHKILLPACFFVGAIFLMICDTFARIIIAPLEIPVGVITALMGGPFLIGVLHRQRGR